MPRTVHLAVMLCAAFLCSLWNPLSYADATPESQSPISSRAQLESYLRQHAMSKTPLGWLSMGGRKRFLAGLNFAEGGGLAGLSYEDPVNELTTGQIDVLLGLFGAAGSVPGKGLTDERKIRFDSERVADATSRGCKIQDCPESEVEQKYDDLVLNGPQETNERVRLMMLARRYDQLFGNYFKASALQAVSSVDLRLLKRAVEHIVFFVPTSKYCTQLQSVLIEMSHRKMDDDSDYARLYDALVAARRLSDANTLAQEHSDLHVTPTPALAVGPAIPDHVPTALDIRDHSAMTRIPIDLSGPLRIVVVAACHFSQDAAAAIEQDEVLRPVFSRNAIWLASEQESFDEVINWNVRFPDLHIRVAWHNKEWSMLDSWMMPTFYVFRYGKLVGKHAGWSNIKDLEQFLRSAAALN